MIQLLFEHFLSQQIDFAILYFVKDRKRHKPISVKKQAYKKLFILITCTFDDDAPARHQNNFFNFK